MELGVDGADETVVMEQDLVNSTPEAGGAGVCQRTKQRLHFFWTGNWSEFSSRTQDRDQGLSRVRVLPQTGKSTVEWHSEQCVCGIIIVIIVIIS